MSKFSVVLLTGIVLFTSPIYGAAVLGVELSPASPIILSVRPHSPAQKARLKPGDKILQINTLPIERAVTVELLLLDASPGQIWRIKVKRNGKTKIFKVKLTRSQLTPEDVVIRKLLLTGNRVVLVFVPLGINIISDKPDDLIQELRESLRNKLIGELEGTYSNLAKRFPNLSIIDRANLEGFIKGNDAFKNGYISEKIRRQLGRSLGITHIYGITFSRNLLSTEVEEVYTRKLVEVDTGRIVSASIVERVLSPEGRILSERRSWEEETAYGIPPYHRSGPDRRKMRRR